MDIPIYLVIGKVARRIKSQYDNGCDLPIAFDKELSIVLSNELKEQLPKQITQEVVLAMIKENKSSKCPSCGQDIIKEKQAYNLIDKTSSYNLGA